MPGRRTSPGRRSWRGLVRVERQLVARGKKDGGNKEIQSRAPTGKTRQNHSTCRGRGLGKPAQGTTIMERHRRVQAGGRLLRRAGNSRHNKGEVLTGQKATITRTRIHPTLRWSGHPQACKQTSRKALSCPPVHRSEAKGKTDGIQERKRLLELRGSPGT